MDFDHRPEPLQVLREFGQVDRVMHGTAGPRMRKLERQMLGRGNAYPCPAQRDARWRMLAQMRPGIGDGDRLVAFGHDLLRSDGAAKRTRHT